MNEKKSPLDLLLEAPQPQWVTEMREHYRKHGWYRAADIIRLLGDPRKRVEVGTREALLESLKLRK